MELQNWIKQLQEKMKGNKKRTASILIGGSTLLVLILIYVLSKTSEPSKEVFHSEGHLSFEEGRILGSAKDVYDRKEQINSARIKELETTQARILSTLEDLQKKMEERAPQVLAKEAPSAPPNAVADKKASEAGNSQPFPPPSMVLNERPKNSEYQEADSAAPMITTEGVPRRRTFNGQAAALGPAVIGFPVKGKSSAPEVNTVTIPSGSFVQAKLLTGIEAPEGKALPVLLQADYAFVGPNKTRIDLSGCFLIAKSTGNLSIERVEMQATKISCVAKSGKMFERDLNGFIADDKDNSFAVIGSVNSKQDRVAAMAFLASIVEGIGKSIQQAQTTTQVNPLGGSTSILTGDEGKYLAASGATNAASTITQWYLRQAQNLLPTINVGSGQSVWIILQESVQLPNWYFKKAPGPESSVFSYLTRITE